MPTSRPIRPTALRWLRLVAIAAVMASILIGPGTAPASDTAASPTIDPDSGLAAKQFVWLLDRVNTAGGVLSPEEVDAHFTARFVQAVGTDAIVAQVTTIASAYAPLTLVEVIQETDDLVHVQARARDGRLVVIAVSIEHSDEKIA
ncbi:MAG: Cpe/LpqF family protein, partial [Thermomicrobiales bacterium]